MFAAIRPGPPRNVDITVEAKGSAILYRKNIARRTALDDLTVTLKVTSGVLGWLGTRTKLSFSARVAEPLDEEIAAAENAPDVRGAVFRRGRWKEDERHDTQA